ncbi:MAG: SCP2 sterol-binding domain-containing protein [Candidatus Hodarchaeota archaeon]
MNRKNRIKDVKGMPTKDEVITSLEKMVGKMEDPKYKSRYADYNKVLQFYFTDNEDATCHIVFNEGTATIVDGVQDDAELVITTTTESIMAIMDGSLSPTRAFMGGKIKAKGPMNDLIKLQALMK